MSFISHFTLDTWVRTIKRRHPPRNRTFSVEPSTSQHAAQSRRIQRSQKGRQQGQSPTHWGQETQEEEEGVLLYLHLQSVEAGAP